MLLTIFVAEIYRSTVIDRMISFCSAYASLATYCFASVSEVKVLDATTYS